MESAARVTVVILHRPITGGTGVATTATPAVVVTRGMVVQDVPDSLTGPDLRPGPINVVPRPPEA
jgi:hypothetical protein